MNVDQYALTANAQFFQSLRKLQRQSDGHMTIEQMKSALADLDHALRL